MSSFLELIELSAERLGGAVLRANDEFFAEKERLLRPEPAVFREGVYTDRGKWMDGWETRRRRTPGFDWCLVRLGLAGVVRGVVVDTSFFRGNFPESCSIEACAARPDEGPEQLLSEATLWTELLPRSPLKGDAKNLFEVGGTQRVSHLRFNIFPDGGVARLRVHGEAVPDWQRLGRADTELDLAAVENGALSLLCSDMFFGERNNMLMPGRAPNMGDGWETRRRRGPGHDWSIVRLAAVGELRRLEIDTNHFKGNYPDTCTLEGCLMPGAEAAELGAAAWQQVLPRSKLQAHTRHFYEEELLARGPFSHLRLNIFPDGGVSRLRVHGAVTREGAARERLRRLNSLSSAEAAAELRGCSGSSRWAEALAARRPFLDPGSLYAAGDEAWAGLGEQNLREAFLSHPRIGETKAQRAQSEAERRFSSEEQAAAAGATEATIARLAAKNAEYEARFGHVFLVFATGKSADEMLAILEQRLQNSHEAEIAAAAVEQRKITRLRLEKMLSS